MIKNVISDLSVLTTIPENTFNKLVRKINYIICDSVIDAKLDSDNLLELNLGIGTLYIQVASDQCKYKFLPSNDLNNLLKNTLETGENPLENILENSLINKLSNTYKDLI